MAGSTDYTAANVLNYLTAQIAPPALTAVWLGLFTTAPTSDSGVTGATEVSGGAYARVQVAGQLTASSAATTIITFASVPAWVVAGMYVRDVTTPGNIPGGTTVLSTTGTTVTCSATVSSVGTNVVQFSAFGPPTASSGAEPATVAAFVQNNAVITFAQATASWGTSVAFGLFDALTSGNCVAWDWLGNFKWVPFTMTSASPGVITMDSTDGGAFSANGLSVVLSAKFDGGLFPTTGGSLGGVLTTAGYAAGPPTTFNVGVNTTGVGCGMLRQVLQQPIAINVTASFAQNTLVISNA